MFSSDLKLPSNDAQTETNNPENKDNVSTQLVFKTLLEAQQIIDDPDFNNIALQYAACAGDITTAEAFKRRRM